MIFVEFFSIYRFSKEKTNGQKRENEQETTNTISKDVKTANPAEKENPIVQGILPLQFQ
jgi:hypothetical protein